MAEPVNAKLRALQEAYAQSLPQRLAQVQKDWQQWLQSEQDLQLLQQIYHQLHNLAGSGKTFGFPQITDIARTLLEVLKPSLQEQRPLPPAQYALINEALQHLLAAQNKHDGVPSVQIADSTTTSPNGVILYCMDESAPIVDSSHHAKTRLIKELETYGHRVTQLKIAGQWPLQVLDSARVLLLDQDLHPAPPAEVRKHLAGRPVAMVCGSDGMAQRLQAIRAGASAYFVIPDDVAELAQWLDLTTGALTAEPFRILVVDDQRSLTDFFQYVLSEAGYQVRTLNDPMTILDVLREFRPELILMDLYMPGCTGREVAAAIRQDQRYLSVPLVFLSAENNPELQMSALEQGADEFLTKPVSVDTLLRTVKSRVARGRMVNDMMSRDSLTGLYNRGESERQLEFVILRAARTGQPLSVAVVDIDHFKRINDSFGHAVGDRVLKSLARLFHTVLRRSDITGRLGGEEFLVVLPDTPLLGAQQVLNKLLEVFSRLPVDVPSDYHASFSAGVAQLQPGQSLESLLKQADDTLYLAKTNGRNQVRLFAPEETDAGVGAQSKQG